MSTETCTPRRSGRVSIDALAIEPIHHGAGTQGNVQLIRQQQHADGTTTPYVSGNSIKHLVREAGVRFALELMGGPGSFTKDEVDLLYSGGRLSRGGSAVDLAGARRMRDIFPILSVCGYSARNAIRDSKIAVSHWHVACEENAYRMPSWARERMAAAAAVPRGRLVRREFGTRRDAAGSEFSGLYLSAPEDARLLEDRSRRGKKSEPQERPDDSAQMIYSFYSLAVGTRLYGDVRYDHLTEMEFAAFLGALAYLMRDQEEFLGETRGVWTIGAKAATGYGRVAVRLDLEARTAPVEHQVQALALSSSSDWVGPYAEMLRANRDAILAHIRETAA